jgi:hypothetical protein
MRTAYLIFCVVPWCSLKQDQHWSKKPVAAHYKITIRIGSRDFWTHGQPQFLIEKRALYTKQTVLR